jgi:hypothetical protein
VPSAVSVLSDPFGMGDFGSHDSGDPSQQELENAIGLLDKRLLEMKVQEFQFLIYLLAQYAVVFLIIGLCILLCVYQLIL